MKNSDKPLVFLCLFIFVIGLIFLLCILNPNSKQIAPNILKLKNENQDYRLIDKINECKDGYEEFYHDDEYIYYFTCTKKDLIYIQWEDGTITKMMDELNTGNISFDSLVKHGLYHNKKKIHEDENVTEEENNTNED